MEKFDDFYKKLSKMMTGFHYMAYPFKITDKMQFSNEEAEQGLTIFFHKLVTMQSDNIMNLLLHFIFSCMNMPIKAQEIEGVLPQTLYMKDQRSFLSKYVFSYIVEKYNLIKLKNKDNIFKCFEEDVAKMKELHKLVAERYKAEIMLKQKAYELRKDIEEFEDIQKDMFDKLANSNEIGRAHV